MPVEKNFYTYAEAQAAAQALGIKSQPDYQQRYREDPRLPADPEKVYADVGWTCWDNFLGREKPNLYSTYAEAQAAAQTLGITSQSDYQQRYSEDPRLPTYPSAVYASVGWANWYAFLGKEKPSFYPTYAEAAVRTLEVKSHPDYKKRYRKDPRLPAAPRAAYAETGWTHWYAFLGKERK